MKSFVRTLFFLLIFIGCLFVAHEGYAQGSWPALSGNGRFEADYSRACAPFTIHLTELDSFGSISRTYTYENNANQTADTFYTYQNPGIYEIVQLLGEDIVPKTDTLTIQVYEASAPLFEWSYCSSTKIALQFPDSVYEGYRWIYDTDTIIFDSTNGWSRSISVQSAQVTVQGYYDNAKNNCGERQISIATSPIRYALTVDEIAFEYLCNNEVRLQINYQPDPQQQYQIETISGVTNPDIIYTGQLTDSLFESDTLSTASTSTELCFTITAISPCDASTVGKETYCYPLETISSPIDYAYSTYNEDVIEIHFDQRAPGQFNLLKYADGLLAAEYTNITSPYQDTNLSQLRRYNYELIYGPQCQSEAYVVAFAPPKISASLLRDNTYQISYSDPIIFSIDEDGVLTDTLTIQGNTDNLLQNKPLEVQLNVNQGQSQSLIWKVGIDTLQLFSNQLTLEYDYIIYVPDVFTPNNDGLNDYLDLFGLPDAPFTFSIFNKWGEKIFETSDQAIKWNGRQTNGHIVEDVYFYIINFYNTDGELFSQQGSFAIIRN